jgi:ATPase family associated with various cellular activities (AAA)
MTLYIRNNNQYAVHSDQAMDAHHTLPVGNYLVGRTPLGEYYLEITETFSLPNKMYGNTLKHTDRILRTFDDRPGSTGILLTGEKGSGKTLLAKSLSLASASKDIPTLIVNSPFCGDGFNKFIQDIQQPCVIIFDEFEKTYDAADQEMVLTLFDGIFSSKKLLVLTCNNRWKISEHMRNRPGRLLYSIDYNGLDAAFIKEYCEDVLEDKSHILKICEIANLFEHFNFDMLQSLVEEMNRYQESPLEAMALLNAKPEYVSDHNNHRNYKVALAVNGAPLPAEHQLIDETWSGNPLNAAISIDVDENPGNNEYKYKTHHFVPSDLTHVNASTGHFLYTNAEQVTLTLTCPRVTPFQFLG